MVQRVTLHTVRRTIREGKAATANSPAVAPQTEDVAPGTLIDVDGEELRELEEAGAVCAKDDRRAARFGYGSRAAEVEHQDGETEASVAKRRRAAATATREPAPARKPAGKAPKGDKALTG